MKKELWPRLFTLCLACTLLSGTVFAIDVTETLTYEVPGTNIALSYQVEQAGNVTITDCNEDAREELEIPSSIDGKSVTAIGNSAFEYCELTGVSVPDSVTSIGCNAFEYCEDLTHIRLSNSLTAIEDETFLVCGLTDLVIPDSVTEIGEAAFAWCTDLKSITIPKSVTIIGEGVEDLSDVFDTCASLNTINIDENNPAFRKVGPALFSKDMSRLVVCEKDIQGAYEIPDGVVKIDGAAFGYCSGLTEILIPDSVTKIGRWAFQDCENLTDVEIPDSVSCIEDAVFWACKALERVTLPDSVVIIGDNAFWCCDHLTGITIPNTVTSIGEYAFMGCDSLTSIVIPKSVTSIGKYALGYSNAQKNFTIYGYPESAAEKYADENWLFTFIPVTDACATNHTPSSTWSYDESGHWHNCAICNEKLDSALHTFGVWKITQAATATTGGNRERVCDICGFKQTESIPAAGGWTIVSSNKESDGHSDVNVYSDIPEDAWYKDAVGFVTEKGLMRGTGNSTFSPDNFVTRAMLVQMLYEHENRPTVNGDAFVDVHSGDWYGNAVTWAAQKDIVSGYGNGKFGPNDNITREQLAAVLWRYAGHPVSSVELSRFVDVESASDYALTALCWAVENGIINGNGSGMLVPARNATRAEAAQMLMGYFRSAKE